MNSPLLLINFVFNLTTKWCLFNVFLYMYVYLYVRSVKCNVECSNWISWWFIIIIIILFYFTRIENDEKSNNFVGLS